MPSGTAYNRKRPKAVIDPNNIYSVIIIKFNIYLLMHLTSMKPSFRDVSIWALQRRLLEKWARHATCNWAARLAAIDSNF
jgi:hypothetical protein